MATPILNSLDHSSDEWLRELIDSMSKGNITKSRVLIQKNSEALLKIANFPIDFEFITQKAIILSLMTLFFSRNSKDRIFSFDEISQFSGITILQVLNLFLYIFCVLLYIIIYLSLHYY